MYFQFKTFYKERRFEFLIFSLFFLYLVMMRSLIPVFPNFSSTPYGDWGFYYKMALDISNIFKSQVIVPFVYRPLVPFIAGILPFNIMYNFILINFISIFLTGIVLFYTLRLYFNKLLSAFGLLFFCYLNYVIPGNPLFGGYVFFNLLFYINYMVDSMAYLFIICCFYSILTSKKRQYCLFLLLGVLTKEVVLFTIPTYVFYLAYIENFEGIGKMFKKRRFRIYFSKILKNVSYVIPGFIAFILIRIITVPEPISNYEYWYNLYKGADYITLEFILNAINFRIDDYKTIRFGIFHYTIRLWGVIIIFSCLLNDKKEVYKWIKFYGVFMALIYLQLIVGYARERLIYIGFFPVINLAILGLNRIFSKETLLNTAGFSNL